MKDSSPETTHEGLPSGGVITGGNMKSTGGSYGGGTGAGVGCSGGNWSNRGNVSVYIGWRSAYVDLESVGL